MRWLTVCCDSTVIAVRGVVSLVVVVAVFVNFLVFYIDADRKSDSRKLIILHLPCIALAYKLCHNLSILMEGNECRGYLGCYGGLMVGCGVDNNDQSYGLVFCQLFFLHFCGLV